MEFFVGFYHYPFNKLRSLELLIKIKWAKLFVQFIENIFFFYFFIDLKIDELLNLKDDPEKVWQIFHWGFYKFYFIEIWKFCIQISFFKRNIEFGAC